MAGWGNQAPANWPEASFTWVCTHRPHGPGRLVHPLPCAVDASSVLAHIKEHTVPSCHESPAKGVITVSGEISGDVLLGSKGPPLLKGCKESAPSSTGC